MPITKYETQTFTKKVFVVEECWFINCALIECDLFYSGGTYQYENTTFQNCNWKLTGPAFQTFQLLSLIGLIPKPGTAPIKSPPKNAMN